MKKEITVPPGIQLIVEEMDHTNMMQVWVKGKEGKEAVRITSECLNDPESMKLIASDMRDGYVPFTNRKQVLLYTGSDLIGTHRSLAELIQQHITDYRVDEGEEIVNIAYCPQTKTLTVKSITHKIIQL